MTDFQLSRRRFIQSMAAMAGLSVVPLAPVVDGATIIDLPFVPDSIEQSIFLPDDDYIRLLISEDVYTLSYAEFRYEQDAMDVEIGSLYPVRQIITKDRAYLDYEIQSGVLDVQLVGGIYPIRIESRSKGYVIEAYGIARLIALSSNSSGSTGTFQFIPDRVSGSLITARTIPQRGFV